MDLLSVEILLGAVAFSATTLLGVSVFLRQRESWTHRLFLLLAAAIDCYIIANFLSLHPPYATPENQLFWIRMVMFVTSFIGPILVLLVSVFPRQYFSLPAKYVIPLLSLMTLSAAASFTPLIFSSISYPHGDPVPRPGIGMALFAADFFGLFILSFVILFVKLRRAVGKEKKSLRYITWGVVGCFSLMALTTNFLVVFFETSALVFLGPIYSVILVIAIAYAIVKHGLFDFKVVAAQALVIGIWILLFSRIFVPKPVTEIIIDGVTFSLTVVFGIFLVRSVRKEVASRSEIERLAQNLRSANTRLKEVDVMKSEFLSFASHQLRSPITAVKGYASLLLDGSYGEVSEKVKTPISRMYQASNALAIMVDDFLNISRIEQGTMKYDITDVDIRKLVEDILNEQKPTIDHSRLNFSFTADLRETYSIKADFGKIKQAVTNIIDNALKYTQEGSVTIHLARMPDAGNIVLSVADTGVGIPPDVLPRLFEKFNRSRTVRGTMISGAGLGLYIVRQIMEAHGGSIEARSEGEGKGAEFILTFVPNGGEALRKKSGQ